MSLIWKKVSRIGSLVPTGGTRRDVGDIEYLSAIRFGAIPGGSLRTDEGTSTTTGTLASITAAGGNQMYVARVKISVGNSSFVAAVRNLVVELRLDGVPFETFDNSRVLFDNIMSSWQGSNYQFEATVGQRVEAGEIVSLEITVNGGNTFEVAGTIECVEVPTGTSPILPQAGAGGGNNLFGESTTLFASLERPALDVSVFEFDMKGAFYAVVVQDGRIVDNSTRTNQDAPIGWTVQAQTDAIDNNISNGIEDLTSGVFSNEMRHDWGSVAVRTPRVVDQLRTTSNQPNTTVSMRVSFSDDNITYGATTIVHSFTAGGPVTQQSTFTFAPTSFRFSKIEAGNTGAASTGAAIVREIYDPALSGGKTDLTFEVFDNERSDWKPLLLTTAIPSINPIETGTTEIRTDQIGEGQINALVMPTATAGGMRLIRAVLTTSFDGVSDTSVVLLKTNTLV